MFNEREELRLAKQLLVCIEPFVRSGDMHGPFNIILKADEWREKYKKLMRIDELIGSENQERIISEFDSYYNQQPQKNEEEEVLWQMKYTEPIIKHYLGKESKTEHGERRALQRALIAMTEMKNDVIQRFKERLEKEPMPLVIPKPPKKN